MDDQERYDRFVSALGFRADVVEVPSEGLDLTALDGEPIDPAVRLHVDAGSLAAHVRDDEGLDPEAQQARDLAADAEPDDVDEPEAARLQTLLAQIEEAILVREPGHDHVVLIDGGVRAVPTADLGTPTP